MPTLRAFLWAAARDHSCAAQRSYVSVVAVDSQPNQVRYATVRPSLLRGPISRLWPRPPSHACACRVARRWQTYFWLLTPLMEHHLRGRVIMNFMSALAAAHTTSTRSWKHEKGAQRLKVRTCMRTLSARMR